MARATSIPVLNLAVSDEAQVFESMVAIEKKWKAA